jgi:hypothetical protein
MTFKQLNPSIKRVPVAVGKGKKGRLGASPSRWLCTHSICLCPHCRRKQTSILKISDNALPLFGLTNKSILEINA